MSRHEQDRLNRFLEGYRGTDAMQEPPGPPGDPQLAALNQYLQMKNALTTDDIVLDFGCGLGVLATVMEAIWPDKSKRPWYYAVDRKSILDKLALSSSIHNHSKKIDADTFLHTGLDSKSDYLKVVVVRNVFHELDITTTAQLLFRLRHLSQPQTELYVQDMVNLPRGERARVGWAPDLFYGVLRAAGFECPEPVCLTSKGGTNWFALLGRQNSEQPPTLTTIEQAIVTARSKQREEITEQLQALSATSDEATTPEYVILQAEEAAISTQLQQYSYNTVRQRKKHAAKHMLAGVIPLASLPSTKLDYAEEVTDVALSRSGLVAVLSSKNLIDFPALLAGCKDRAYFMGYSQRSLFQNQPTSEAVVKALGNGADFKVLLVNPSSEVTIARAKSLAYTSYEDLIADINYTRGAFKAFLGELSAQQQFALSKPSCELRLMSTIPPCSYFIIDDLCYVSLYSLRLSGGSGPCLVFRNDPMEPNAYFAILLQEFQLAWDGSTNDA